MGLLSQQNSGAAQNTNNSPSSRFPIWQEQTHPLLPVPPANNTTIANTPLPPLSTTLAPVPPSPVIDSNVPPSSRRTRSRIIAIAFIVLLVGALYMVWHTTPTPPSSNITTGTVGNTSVTQQNFRATGAANSGNTQTNTGDIQVYIVGAVKHPGVYTLSANARVYELLQAAGGPLPQANLVALNLVAKLHDGQEVYVTAIGETASVSQGNPGAQGTVVDTTGGGQCVINVNTASVSELQTALHISSKSAKAIVDHRVQQGDYTSVQELSAVVSKTIYNKIKDKVCTS